MMHITADAPLWIVSRVMINSRSAELISLLEKTKKTYAPEDIHDLRVASRRLREAITLFSPCFPAKKLSRIKAEAKQLTDLLGAMRNTDEAVAYFLTITSSLPDTVTACHTHFLELLQIKRTKELKHLTNQLKRTDLALVRYELQRALKRPLLFTDALYDPFLPINQFFKDKILERETVLQQLLPDSLIEQNSSPLHRLRIAMKKFRYAFELTAPIILDGYKQLLTVIKDYQEVLGKIHDLDVFFEHVQKLEFDQDYATALTNHIISCRTALFANYLTLHAKHPIDKLGECARKLL